MIDFFDTSSSEAEIISWTWDFGDGTISNLQNPIHFYQENQQYTVCLNIEDANGCPWEFTSNDDPLFLLGWDYTLENEGVPSEIILNHVKISENIGV